MELVIATHNKNKIKEYEELFAGTGIRLLTPADPGLLLNVQEDGKSYAENALKKAKALSAKTSLPVFSDDSGLEIRALDDFPGLSSARYAAGCGGHAPAMKKILDRLKDKKDRRARFVCVIALLNVEKTPRFFQGICPGRILEGKEGDKGFGYDPIFHSTEAGLSFGGASDVIKNRFSHRAKAVRELITFLKAKGLLPPPPEPKEDR